MISLREEEAVLSQAAAPVHARIERTASEASSYQVRQLLTHVRRELLSPELTVASWMAACRLSVAEGSRLFAAEIGLPADSFLWDCRLEVAAGLLIDTDLGTGEIGKIVGFTSRRGFKGSFESWSGLTPEAFRREIRRFPGLLSRSGESRLSRDYLTRLVACRLVEEEVGELLDRLWTVNLAYWSTQVPGERLERLFAEELWERRLSDGPAPCEAALYQLCFSTPALDELLAVKLASPQGPEGR